MYGLLRKNGIARAFDATPEVARSILEEHGVYPVDFGRGRGRGLRWYAAAVEDVILALHNEAQAQALTCTQKSARQSESAEHSESDEHPVVGRSVDELYQELNDDSKVQ